MPSLSTHVLDLYHGAPAHGVKIEVRYQSMESTSWTTIKTVTTNVDGRCDEQIITEDDWQPGHYELVFEVGSYFAQKSIALPDPSFLSTIPIRFTMHPDAAHYHVPLLVSPWGYQIYRGS